MAFTDSIPDEVHQKAEYIGSQLHLWSFGNGWRPLRGERLHRAAQRTSFIWRESTGSILLNYNDGEPNKSGYFHSFQVGSARDGGQYWSFSFCEGKAKALASGFVKPTLQPGDAVTLQYAVIGDHHYGWVNDRLVVSITHPVGPSGGEFCIQCSEAVLDRYEYLPLDGLSDADALKLLKIDKP